MKFSTLYSRTSIGQIQVWEIEAVGDSFFTREGIFGGKMTESTPTICLPKNVGKKNETSAEQQALKEAEAKWKKKIKSGGYWEDIDRIDEVKFLEPMRAESLKDFEHKVVYPCMLDRKYNGGRIVHDSKGQFTRTGEVYKSIPHIKKSLEPLFEKFPSLVLDGEGYNHEYRYKLNELMHILRTNKDEKLTSLFLQESEDIVRFYVYDGFNFEIDGVSVTEQTPCIERREMLKKLLVGYEFVVVVDYVVCNNMEDILFHYNSFVEDGYEGAMVRNSNAVYQFKRTSDLLKVKPVDDSEGIIISIQEGVGNSSGLAATATVRWSSSKDQIFNVTFKEGKKNTRKKILEEKDWWIGREVTFLYNGLTGLGTPNYGRIDPDNCFKKFKV